MWYLYLGLTSMYNLSQYAWFAVKKLLRMYTCRVRPIAYQVPKLGGSTC